ncbi:MAG: transporter substrate-binding domain-containing protein [Colwellia sp.]|nr:transporter substrate-binding domain-containing protein [Colwellia sp.]
MILFQYLNKLTKPLLLITIVLLPTLSWAKTLNIVVGLDRPPYIYQENNSGYELELLSQVITLMGYDVSYIYVPYGRTQLLLSEPDIDAITTMTIDTEPKRERLTDTYVTYHNSVVSLAESELEINQLSDLKYIGVISFHNAKSLLGKEYHDAVINNPDYIEIPQQQSQVKLFLQDRVHCIVIDKNIFQHLFKQLKIDIPVVVHNIFPPTEYQMAFKDPKLVSAFNKHLADFKTSRQYKQLQHKYLAEPL